MSHTKPFSMTSHTGRARERDRRVLLTMVSSAGSRFISLVSLLISIPLTVNYLGSERYALWATIASLLSLLTFADLGVGNGLLNAIAECHGRDDDASARKYVSAAFVILSGIALASGAAFAFAYPWISWKSLFNIADPLAIAEAGPAAAVLFFCFAANIPLGIVQRVQQGYQEGFIDSLWNTAGKILALAGLVLVVWFKAGLPWLVSAVVGVPVIVTFINGIVLFTWRKPHLRPRITEIDRGHSRRIIDAGFLFFVIQVAGAVAYSADNLVLAHIVGPSAVTEYNVVYQMFSLSPVLLSMFLNPLWPAYGEALTRGDSGWIRATFRRSIIVGVSVNLPFAVGLMLFGNAILHIWIGRTITASLMVLAAFGIWTVMNSFNGAIAVFLNGTNVMRFQAVCASVMAFVNLALSILLTKAVGLSGVIWGSIIAQLAVVLVPSAIYISRLMPRLISSAPSGTALEARTLV